MPGKPMLVSKHKCWIVGVESLPTLSVIDATPMLDTHGRLLHRWTRGSPSRMLRRSHDLERIVSTQQSITIRSASIDDVPLILQLIHELAVFEKLEHECHTTAAELREHLFGPRPYAEVLIASLDNQPVGFALFFHNYSTFLSKPGIYLEDLYVREAFRAHGVGTALLQAVRRLAVDRGCGRFEWSVLNWNQRAIDFYEKMGAKPMSEWTIYRLSGAALKGSN